MIDARAIIAHAGELGFTVEDVELDEPRADEILVRLAACGVCHTDLSMRRVWPRIPGNEKRSPVVFGHEGAGIVERVGCGVTRVRPGDTVVLSYRSCRACPECAAGHPYYCRRFGALNASGVRPDGSTTLRAGGRAVYGSFFGQSSFATYALAYEDNAVVIGPDVDPSVVAPFGCGVQTGAGTVMNVLDLDERSSLVVFGAGGVGLSAVMAARALGVSTIVVDPVESRRRLAVELGASTTIDPKAENVVEAVRDHTGGGATGSIETTAIVDVLFQALDCLATRGTCVALGVDTPPFTFGMERLSGGRSLRRSIEGDADPHEFVPKLLDLHARGLLPVEKLIRTYPFEDFEQAVRDAESGETIKPVLVFDQ
ncbi:NAD(P)-dependent alcohol dehydrogenase [Nonomuraea sp. NPDC026600]|uniref:NAD(P)-dependent alcohol dehydrogenase n=1 Tax=Nonomuraea sp. NPDC026600 TaxID=3155363 RepID=UPI00340964A6